MDVEWALEELRAFIDLTTLERPAPTLSLARFGDFRYPRGGAAIAPAAQIVKQILGRVLPTWRRDIAEDQTNRRQQHRQAAQRATAQLKREAELREKLGDNASRLDVAVLHPWVWDGARSDGLIGDREVVSGLDGHKCCTPSVRRQPSPLGLG